MRAFAVLLALLVATVGPAGSRADVASATLMVTASVPPNCEIAAQGAIDFGVYDTELHAHDGPVDVTMNAVSVACSRGASGVTIALGNGEYADGRHRGMAGPGTGTVAYDIYTTPERSTVWNAVNTVAYVPQTSRPTTIPLYGRIPAGQTVPPGRYSDVLLAMVNF